MRELSITQFRSLCEKTNTTEYIFDTKNQNGGENEDVKQSVRYSEMVVMLSPGRICFKNPNGILCFDRVKSIIYNEDLTSTCSSFNIICGNIKNSEEDSSYIMLAQKNI